MLPYTASMLSRFWEVLPGALVWGILLAALLVSLFAPLAAIIFIVAFDVLWLFRVFLYLLRLAAAWRRFREAIHTDWSARIASDDRARGLYHLIFLPTYQEDLSITPANIQEFGCGFLSA